MSKNIWILNHYAISPNLPGGTRHFDFACELVKKGYRVKIFACDVILGKNKEHAKLKEKESYSVENINGVEFIWVRAATYERNNWRRAWNMLTFSYNCYKIGCKFKDKPEVIIGSSPHPFAALAAVRLARKLKAKFFLEIRDLWPQVIVDMGKLNEHHLIIQAMRLLEKYLYRAADKLIVLAEGSKKYLIEKSGIKESKILYLPNGVHLNNFSCQKDRDVLRKLYNFTKFTLIYTGAHGPANSLDTILRAANRLRENKDIEIVLVGDGILKERLLKQAKEMKLNNVRFFDSIPKNEIPGILRAADAAIITLKKVKVFSYGVSPNKLFDYMAAQKPIICAVEGEMAEKVENIGCGISAIPEDENSMAEAIIRLINLPQDELKKMGDNGYEEIKENYSREKLAQKLIDLIEQ
ncbi:MAG TPA: glycosyltransferase family 4 protein [Atribacterota bacterium]|nr:glycosyltransferase family 4 protein [Atribacterota bacterium]